MQIRDEQVVAKQFVDLWTTRAWLVPMWLRGDLMSGKHKTIVTPRVYLRGLHIDCPEFSPSVRSWVDNPRVASDDE